MTGAPRTSRPATTGTTGEPRAASRSWKLIRALLVAVLMLGIGYGIGLFLGLETL